MFVRLLACRGSRVSFASIFKGVGGLSAALADRGLAVSEGLEAYPHPGIYRPEHDLAREEVFRHLLREIRARAYSYVHFGLPCRSWSAWQRINPNSTRSSTAPEGTDPSESELEANALASRVSALCLAQGRAGGFWSIENPLSSLVWAYGPIEALCTAGFDVDFAQCAYGLRTDPEPMAALVKKATRIRTNMPSLAGLEARCSGNHPHQRCCGKIRTISGWTNRSVLAGAYPPALCLHWAGLVSVSLEGPGR